MNYELKSKKIDVLDWKPGEIETKMLGRKAGGKVITTNAACSGMFKHLGKESWSSGKWQHGVVTYIMTGSIMPMESFKWSMVKKVPVLH